ncbi:MAG: hypothetical protein V1797_16815 [Pseudomonadota bacterium]
MSKVWRITILAAMFLGGIVGGITSQQFSSLVASAAPVGNDLEVNSIRIVDSAGKLRGLLGMVDNQPQIKLFGSNGHQRFAVMADDAGGVVIVSGSQGKPSIMLQTKGENSSYLTFHKSTGGILLSAGLNNGQPFTILLDNESKPRIMLGSEGDNYMLKLFDRRSRIRCGLGLIDDEPQLLVIGNDGKSSAVVKVSNDNSPQLGVFDNNAVLRSTLAVDNNSSSLTLNDETGKLKMMLSAGLKGGSKLALSTESGKIGLMAYGKNDAFGLGIFNARGTDSFAVQADSNGSALGFMDRQQKMRAVAGVRGDKPWIGVLDPAGAPVWGSPGSAPNLPQLGDLDAATRDLLR